MRLTMLTAFFLSHWLADFVFQTDSMALNKSKSFIHLNWHCLVYAFTMSLYYSFFFRDITVLWFFVTMYLSHILIDGMTSQINEYLYNKKMRKWFFCSVGFDQVLHYFVIFGFLQVAQDLLK